jgi:hypothetical protein
MFSSDEEDKKPRKLDLDEVAADGFKINEKFAEKYLHN